MTAPFSMRRLGRDTIIYGLGIVVGRLAAFIMLPVYTHVLSTADYGLLEMLGMAVEVAALMVSGVTTIGVMKFYYQSKTEEERQATLFTAFVFQMVLNGLGTLAIVAASRPIWHHILSDRGTPGLVMLAAVNFSLGAIATVPMVLMQVEQRSTQYMLVGIVKLLLQLFLNILFLVHFNMGPFGILLSTFIASALAGLYCASWMLRRIAFDLRAEITKRLWLFGLPYQLVTAGAFILTFGDRFFLQSSHGLGAVGVYGIAYQFGFLLGSLGGVPYMRAWNPQRFQLANEPREVRDARYQRGFLFYSLLLITLALGMAVFVRPVLRIVSSAGYLPAASIVPVILIAYVFQCWTDVVQLGIDVSGKTKFATYATWISVVTVVIAYLLLIPPLGGLGAALATMIAFLVRLLAFHYFSQKLWPVTYHWRPHLTLLAYASALVGILYLIRPESLGTQFGLAAGLFLVYLVLVWFTILSRDDHRLAKGLIHTSPRRWIAELVGS